MPQNEVTPATGVGSITAGDTSIVVGGTAAAPTVVTASLAVIAADHASAGAITASSQKITNLANGTVATDAAAFGQITAANAGAVALSTVTAAGDLIAGTGNGTVGRLAVGTAGQRLVPIAGTPAWRTMATLVNNPAAAAATTSGSLVMSGYGGAASITPAATGVIMISIIGFGANSGLNNNFLQIRFGTGTAPVNGAANTGSAGSAQITLATTMLNFNASFCLVGLATGLTLGTAVWIDLAQATSGGTFTQGAPGIVAVEV